ncbi:hypothetical protein [Arsukibacterium sp.]|uniref:hypothetical protein n=1 Tax=Arsukibacterium sp. TaxID=1977258 RepID=UPI001BD450A3|nr:hypothetical protein [Arsukibacterium sp.]
MKYWPALVVATGIATIGYFSLFSGRLTDTTAPSNHSGAMSAGSALTQQQAPTQRNAGRPQDTTTPKLAISNGASTIIANDSNNELTSAADEPDLNQQAQRFAAAALANGYFNVDEVDAMLLSDNFDELAGYLTYQHDDDIQVRLDVEQQLANAFNNGAVINNINCGSYICLLSIDAGNNDDIESIVNKAISSDDKVKTVVYRSVVINGQEQLRAVFSYNDKINAVVIPQSTGS